MGKLVNEQVEFARDIGELIAYSEEIGVELTFGEPYRPKTQQLLYFMGRTLQRVGNTLRVSKAPRRSATMNSMHMKRLAVDFNLFVDGKLTWDIEDYRPLGEFWEELSPKNKWGGNWTKFRDAPHFQRSVD